VIKLAWRWGRLLIFAGLAGCAVAPDMRDAASDAFIRTGRFALTAQDVMETTPEAVQGGFTWHDDGHTLRLDLNNPLGSTLAQVRVEPGRAVLLYRDGRQEQAADPDMLVARVLGRTVPLADLRVWLRGQVMTAATGVERDAQGRLVAFSQAGWRVQLSRFDAQGPRLLRLSRQDADRRVHMRLVIDSP